MREINHDVFVEEFSFFMFTLCVCAYALAQLVRRAGCDGRTDGWGLTLCSLLDKALLMHVRLNFLFPIQEDIRSFCFFT
jgi:hypothetical protein